MVRVNINSSEEEIISKLFVYENSNNDNVKKLINSFITLNGYEAWHHKCIFIILFIINNYIQLQIYNF